MALLRAENISKAFGIDVLFDNVNLEIQRDDKIGFIGDNGSGKTTLFKILMGQESSDSGTVNKGASTIGYMEQHVCRDPDISSYSEVLSIFSRLLELEQKIEYVNQQLRAADHLPEAELHSLVEKQAAVQDEYIQNGGMTFRSFTREVMKGLGFDEEKMSLPVVKLSGGQKAKLQLAKLLLSKADVLLLDEPTNHLDIAAVEWLEQFLIDYKGALVVISHDRFFLDRVTGKTWELDNKTVTAYKGNYTTFKAQKDERTLAAQRKYDNTMSEINRLQGVVKQQRQWNREKNIKTAESKLKVIERLENSLEEVHINNEQIKFSLSPKQRGGDDVLDISKLSLSFGQHRIFSNLELKLKREDKVFLLGPNGCGKTSLIKTLMGIYEKDEGIIRLGAGITLGYYDQLQEGLDESKTVIDAVWDKYPKLTHTQVRSVLAQFLFTGDDVFKDVASLSGGEKARILLTLLMLAGDNCLLLDEPTNHLDIKSCEALENALIDYGGTMLIISHDRYLINKLATKILMFTPDGLEAHNGNYDDYMTLAKKRAVESIKKPVSAEKAEKKAASENKAEQRRIKAELRRTESEIERHENEIAALEEELSQPEIAGDYSAILERTGKLDALKISLEQLMEQWEELSMMVTD